MALLAGLTGCGSAQAHITGTKQFRSPTLGFSYPAQWHVWPQGDPDFSGPWAVAIANAALRPACKTGAPGCGLHAGEFEFTWYWCDPPTSCGHLKRGDVVSVGSGTARRQEGPGAHWCARQGAPDADVRVWWSGTTPAPGSRGYFAAACLREPETAASVKELDTLMASVRFPTKHGS